MFTGSAGCSVVSVFMVNIKFKADELVSRLRSNYRFILNLFFLIWVTELNQHIIPSF